MTGKKLRELFRGDSSGKTAEMGRFGGGPGGGAFGARERRPWIWPGASTFAGEAVTVLPIMRTLTVGAWGRFRHQARVKQGVLLSRNGFAV